MSNLIKLNSKERKRRDELVAKINRNVEDTAKCLMEIRDTELYIETHETFEAFIAETFNRTKQWAYQLIEAAQVWERVNHGLLVKGENKPQPLPNNRQSRELAKAPEEKQAEVWSEVVAEGKPTAAKVAEKVAKISHGNTFDVAEIEAAAEVNADLAKKNRALAHAHRDKLARAICDYHEVNPNRSERDRLVKLVQGVELW